MRAYDQLALDGVEEAPAPGHGPQQILRPHDWVMLAEAVDLGLDVRPVGRIGPRNLRPIDLEVAADAVVGLGLAVGRDLACQQGVVGPDSPRLYSMTVTFPLLDGDRVGPVARRSGHRSRQQC